MKTVALGNFLLGVFWSSDHAGSPWGNHLSGELLRPIREECKPPTTTKPIVETYLEGSSTFRENGSTEVLEKEERGVWKSSGKLLVEKKKRENGSKLRLKDRVGTNSRPGRGTVIHRREPKWLSFWGLRGTARAN